MQHASVNLGSACKWPSYSTVPDGSPWTPCSFCNPNRFIFGDNKNFWYLVVPLNNFSSMNNYPWVQGKSKKPPPPSRGVCCFLFFLFFWGGGGLLLFYDFTSIFTFINTHEYANDIIL